MRYVELAFGVPIDAAEPYAEALVEAGAAGVEERDQSTIERPTAGRVVLVVWLAAEEAAPYLERLRDATRGLPAAEVVTRDRQEDEWRDAWKRHFSVRRVGRFVLVPSWETYAAREGEWAIALDPGRAFGTGGHASTRLCLRVLGELEGPCAGFVDVGCGSGVLAIGCALRWPKARGVGVDVDPEAVAVSRENAAINRVEGAIEFSTAPIEEVAGTFDLVTANIQPEVLIPMAGTLAARVADGGRLVLSGILVEAAPPVEAAYLATGLRLERRDDEEGWRALTFGR